MLPLILPDKYTSALDLMESQRAIKNKRKHLRAAAITVCKARE